MVSLGAHAAAVIALAFVLAAPSPALQLPSVDLSLVNGDGPGGRAAAWAPSRPSREAPGTALPLVPAAAAAPRSDAPAPATVAPEGSAADRAARSQPLASSLPAPAASDVLADVAAVSSGTGSVPGAAASVGPGGAEGTQWGWQGLPRRLIRKRDPEFPVMLRAMGQEIEGEARISVAPSGIVSRVEITRSSGYIEIDASVEAALRDYLFSRVDGRVDSVGTVQFRFRLEKQD